MKTKLHDFYVKNVFLELQLEFEKGTLFLGRASTLIRKKAH